MAGAPSKFTPDMCEIVVDLMREGANKVEICAELGISKPTLYFWSDPEHELYKPEFKAAIDEGMVHAQAFWEKALRQAALGHNKDANPTLMIFTMKNRFRDDWSDVQKVESNVSFAQISDQPINAAEWLSTHKPT